MPKLWGRPLVPGVLVSVLALFLWPILGGTQALAVWGTLLLLLFLHHVFNLSRLYRWLEDPRSSGLPEGSGVWEDIYAALARLLKRRTQIESRLSAALERFQEAGAALPEGLIILDEADCIEWCNPKAEAYFGLSSERDRNQQITYLVRHPPFVEYLETRNYREPLVLRLMRSEGELTLSIQLVPYGDSQKLLLSRDITRWERMETTRRDFVANVSHELRTPLTVLGGFLETLSEATEHDPAMLRRSLQLMSEQTYRMQRLVEDLLTLSRLESAHNPLREEPVDVPELLRSLHRDAQALSEGRHRLSLRLENTGGIRGSAEELRSAFLNLISNAVRYTPENGEIEVSWVKRDGEPMLSVRDTGIGIEPHHIPRLTERFYRVDRSRSRGTGGTGLGLAIVKHVLSRHQAHLEIESEPGKGSTFRAVFPASRSAVRAQPAIVAVAADQR
ncbi:MAG TPA: phosphate regulon sensor histidine kinase PhoR [Burkholderiales bacterium]|nr:phosphate regulon sensor histidine kinase PhoR [Burkholderiales bacterium]